MKRKPYTKSHIRFHLSPVTEGVLRVGLTLILLSTLGTLFTLAECSPLSATENAYFTSIAEYLITTTALLTAGAYLIERVAREREHK